jgi:hypothetical protein
MPSFLSRKGGDRKSSGHHGAPGLATALDRLALEVAVELLAIGRDRAKAAGEEDANHGGTGELLARHGGVELLRQSVQAVDDFTR